ncbi:MAG: hypothetical protein JWN04_3624, partial [Myxococcaceae bacterium]|nr:hypothetical protein [Myxococcaceae bacterium]
VAVRGTASPPAGSAGPSAATGGGRTTGAAMPTIVLCRPAPEAGVCAGTADGAGVAKLAFASRIALATSAGGATPITVRWPVSKPFAAPPLALSAGEVKDGGESRGAPKAVADGAAVGSDFWA